MKRKEIYQIPTDANIEWANIGKVCLAMIIVSTITSLIACVLGGKKQLPGTVVEFQLLAPSLNLLATVVNKILPMLHWCGNKIGKLETEETVIILL